MSPSTNFATHVTRPENQCVQKQAHSFRLSRGPIRGHYSPEELEFSPFLPGFGQSFSGSRLLDLVRNRLCGLKPNHLNLFCVFHSTFTTGGGSEGSGAYLTYATHLTYPPPLSLLLLHITICRATAPSVFGIEILSSLSLSRLMQATTSL